MPPQAPKGPTAPNGDPQHPLATPVAGPPAPPVVATETYRLECAADRPFVYLSNAAGEPLAELFVLSGVHSGRADDDATRVGAWREVDLGDHVLLELSGQSSIWSKKTYRFRCWPDRIGYEVEVEGEGEISSVDYFGGYSSASVRWGSGYFWSGSHFGEGFNPEPTREELYRFDPRESSRIDLTGVPLAGSDGWFFTPPPFCFAFSHSAGWLALGVEAQPGENVYGELDYSANRDGFCLRIPFGSRPAVTGRKLLPGIGFDFASGDSANEYAALGRHVDSLRAQRLVPTPRAAVKPGWWTRPIFCGWGAQCHLASESGGKAPDQARQQNYVRFLKELDDQGLSPGTVVIDDKWQSTYGENRVDEEKWPDLPGFIEEQHASGRKVLLWLKAWDPEGVPAGECVTNAAGLPVAVDPGNPGYERRFRDSIRYMLSPQGLNADGFKLDFTARLPASPGLRLHDTSLWGIELMRSYLAVLHGEAKAVKADALVMTHTPHPYLADLVDMIRLNDINVDRDVVASMSHRARVARLACPEAVIDTDNWPVTDRESWRSYLQVQPTLGVSSLYFVSHIDSTGEALCDEDFELVRKAWGTTPAGTSLAGVGE